MKQVTVKLEAFSGPLDLLLSFIEERKVSISEIALAEVTEQYILALEKVDEDNADELADFLVVATRLLLLKSKTLLPSLLGSEDEGPSLEEQLKLYKVFVDASKRVSSLWIGSAQLFFRIEPLKRCEEFVPPKNVTVETLHNSIKQVISRLTPPKPLPRIALDRTISVRDKIQQIRTLLQKARMCYFSDVVQDKENRTDVIIGFLAILELIKQQHLTVRQADAFGQIVLEPV